MPRKASAKKAARVEVRRREYNKPVRSAAKTYITKAERLIRSGELDGARVAVIQAQKALDRAAKKGVIHPNNAARRKSRLMKKLAKALASSEVSL